MLQRKLVVVLERSGLGRLEPADTEVEQDRLFRPGVHPPGAVVAPRIQLGDADGPPVQELDRLLDRRRIDRSGRVRRDLGPAALDPLLELEHVLHVRTSERRSSSADAARAQASTVGTIAIRTKPSPSRPKNDPGATTMSPRSRRSSAHPNEVCEVGTRTQR